MQSLPERFETEAQFEEVLSRPRSALIEFITRIKSPLLLLGAGGKMGPSLALLAKRAAEGAGHPLRIIAVSRFSDAANRRWFESRGIETLACDLLEPAGLKDLPEAENIIYLAGLKFGTQQNPSLTWAVNTLVPAGVAERYPASRITALSTGNVYPPVAAGSGGSVETDSLTPLGEYSNAAVARERIFDYFSRRNATPIALLRLNYAVEMRYGVLVDIARKVWENEPIDVTMGWLNCIWQGDANEFILRSLALANAPAETFNLTGPDRFSVRKLAMDFAALMRRTARITGTEADTALLSNTTRLRSILGEPLTDLRMVIRWTADWIMRGMPTLGKPTHFEVRDGKY